MRQISRLFIIAGLSIGLAGCIGAYGPGPSNGSNSIEGAWLDTNRVELRFTGGKYEARTTDGTNTLLARGTYTQTGPRAIRVDYFSLFLQANKSFNCLLVGPERMNCTSQDGEQTALTRRIA